jgi:hypothetical protein
METQFNQGNRIIAGPVTTDQLKLAAATYYQGQLLEYQGAVSSVADVGNTGDGTLNNEAANSEAPNGDYVLEFTGALTADLKDPNGNVLAQITILDGGAKTFSIEGLTFTVTDGATPFVATDFFTITVADGQHAPRVEGKIDAIFNGKYNADGDVLAALGYRDCIIGGEVCQSGLVDASGNALTVTASLKAEMRNAGFMVKRN